MRNPEDYLKALIVSQSSVTCTYIAIGVVVYYYCGLYQNEFENIHNFLLSWDRF